MRLKDGMGVLGAICAVAAVICCVFGDFQGADCFVVSMLVLMERAIAQPIEQ